VGAETHTLTVGEMPSHSHGITDPGHTHGYVNNVNDQSTDNAFSTETAADQVDINATTGSSTTGITINNTGGGGAHNNMQPTIFMGNVFIHSGKWTTSGVTTTLV
jgi:microcystin-dependent protein